MKLYADLPVRRAFQIASDVGVLCWAGLWLWVSGKVHDATLRLAVPGRRIDGAAGDLATRLRDAGSAMRGIPLVGDDARRPFDDAGRAADGLAGAGRAQVEAVQHLAFWLALAVALLPVLVALIWWLPARVRFVRRASAGRRYLDTTADLDLFALRAMAHQPLHLLARISNDPVHAWRRSDPDVVTRLADLELRAAGLRRPAQAPDATSR